MRLRRTRAHPRRPPTRPRRGGREPREDVTVHDQVAFLAMLDRAREAGPYGAPLEEHGDTDGDRRARGRDDGHHADEPCRRREDGGTRDEHIRERTGSGELDNSRSDSSTLRIVVIMTAPPRFTEQRVSRDARVIGGATPILQFRLACRFHATRPRPRSRPAGRRLPKRDGERGPGRVSPAPNLANVRFAVPRHIARWDLDKTYLRTEFDTSAIW